MSEGAGDLKPGLAVWQCSRCGAQFFPRRLLCLRCECPDFTQAHIHEGRVEEITVVRHVLGQGEWTPRRIANVRAADGLMLTVGLLDEAGVGAHIELFQREGAPFGRSKARG